MKRILLTLLFAVPLCLSIFAQKERQKVAVVFGGGGAKGAAEVGVLKYIEESGIPVDYVVGTSIGSIVGGLYSVGYTSQQLDSMFRSQEWLDLLMDRSKESKGELIEKGDNGLTYILGFPVNLSFKKRGNRKFTLGALQGDSIVSTLDRMTGIPDSISFDNLPKPYRCVAVDVNRMQEVVLSSGNLAGAMRASMAIPLAFHPASINGRTLVDGGVMNNLPVDVAREMGADVVIAIDLAVNKPNQNDSKEDDDNILGSILGKGLAAFNSLSLLKPGLLNNTQTAIGAMAQWFAERPDRQKYIRNVEDADLYINPNLKGFGAQDFNAESIAAMIELGEKAGKASAKKLKKLKKKIYK
ncbi:MAG: patatin-like phospholipase family protein [Prevotellaceae bacterium]|nr:patatin-like phospholipase family protein [Candidatus Minthosoma equi]